MPRPLNILMVEDSPDDAELTLAELHRAGFDPKWKRVETELDFLAEIKNSPDIILSDYSMPQFSGLRAAKLLQESGLEIPFILISGTVGEEVAVEAMQHGATDYLLKDRLARLGIAVEHALEQKRLRDERNRMEDARRASEARYRTLFDYAPDGIVITDPNSYYLAANPSICRMLGYTREEFIGLHASNIVSQKEVQNIAPALSTIKARTDYHREWQFKRKDGSVFEAEVITTAMPDGNLLGLIRDITERKRIEEALNEAEALYHSLVDQMPAGVFRKDAEGRFVFVNSWYCQIKGMTPEQILGKTPRELAASELIKHPEAAKEIPLAMQGADNHKWIMETGKRIHVEEQYPGADGKIQFWQVVKSPVFGSNGNIIGTQGIFFDITERKQADAALAHERNLLRTMIDNSPDTIYIKDLAGRKTLANQAELKNMGCQTEAEAIGKSDFDIFPQELAAGYFADDQAVIQTGQSVINREEKIVTPAGETRWILSSKIPLRSTAGNIIGLVGMGRDITERRQIESQLLQSQKMETVGKLAGGVAHDFNNILAVIQLQADLLKIGGNLSPEQLELAEEIGMASQRASALTRQLLMFSRQETLKLCDLDLNQSLNDMTKLLRRTLGEDIQLQFKFALQPLFIHADAGMLDQVLMNLAVNSRDAMPEGGKLVIETSAVDFDEAAVSHSGQIRPGKFVCLSVSDTGCGIPPENLSRIFEPFFTTKETGKGTGLGLATVFGIAQQHKGWINVYSENGHGTTFRIYLPRLAGMSEQKPEQSNLTAMRGGKEIILLVEDDAFLHASVRKILSHLGYRVLDATDGVEALEVWNQRRDEIHLLLTDLVMPGGINGIELAAQLLELKPELKVIYASGYSVEVARKDFPLEEGVNFLSKPFEAHKLAQTVRQSLDADI